MFSFLYWKCQTFFYQDIFQSYEKEVKMDNTVYGSWIYVNRFFIVNMIMFFI